MRESRVAVMTDAELSAKIRHFRTRATRCKKPERAADCIAEAQQLEEELDRRRENPKLWDDDGEIRSDRV